VCGVVEQERRRQPTREVGWCALINGATYAVSSAVGGSPYWPRTMNPPVNASEFSITEDAVVLTEFPQLELVYTFVEFDREDADVRRGVRVDGGEIIELSNVSLMRQEDGASLLRVAGGELAIHRTENRRQARIEVLTAPTTYNPDEEEAALRTLAEALVARAQAQRAQREAQGVAPDPEPAPAPQ
jgi:hypothetical protein